MIKNELFDGVESMKRKLVHKKIMEEDEVINTNKKHHGHSHTINKEIVTSNKESDDKKSDTIVKNKEKSSTVGVYNKNMKSDNCSNSLTCADFVEDTKMKQKGFEGNNMKELYDFVFDDDKNTDDLLEKQFNVPTTQLIEKNEIDLHHENKTTILKDTEEDIMKCNFEIIGNIDDDDENAIVGLDYLSQNAFAKMI